MRPISRRASTSSSSAPPCSAPCLALPGRRRRPAPLDALERVEIACEYPFQEIGEEQAPSSRPMSPDPAATPRAAVEHRGPLRDDALDPLELSALSVAHCAHGHLEVGTAVAESRPTLPIGKLLRAFLREIELLDEASDLVLVGRSRSIQRIEVPRSWNTLPRSSTSPTSSRSNRSAVAMKRLVPRRRGGKLRRAAMRAGTPRRRARVRRRRARRSLRRPR